MAVSLAPFQINDVFAPTRPLEPIKGPVRVLAYKNLDKVALIHTDPKREDGPFLVSSTQWMYWLDGSLERITDPYEAMPSARIIAASKAQKRRLDDVMAVVNQLPDSPCWLLEPAALGKQTAKVMQTVGRERRRTITRSLIKWLKSGRKPAAAILNPSSGESGKKDGRVGPQVSGLKRGRKATLQDLTTDLPAQSIEEPIKFAYTKWLKTKQKTVRSAYFAMLEEIFKIPKEYLRTGEGGKECRLFLSEELIKKYPHPSLSQFKDRVTKYRKADKPAPEPDFGDRGKATDGIHGPGIFEIDATFFQIQLTCRITKKNLIGRPCVYLIVDVWSNAIVGFHVTLENPSWAAAAQALHNCYSDKTALLQRINPTYTGDEWPCAELPCELRADRGEFVSNRGQEFSHSGIRVRITPSMRPEAKGSVEGKHSELKHSDSSTRFDLCGLFAKQRERRQPDGKANAAIDFQLFIECIVDAILDLNRKPIPADKVPTEALEIDDDITSRIGYYRWGLRNHPGFTFSAGPNFAFEHLLHRGKACVTPRGITFKQIPFNCDHLRQAGFLKKALSGEYALEVRYNPNFCDEIFFFDPAEERWIAAFNQDERLNDKGHSFKEARHILALIKLTLLQTAASAYSMRSVSEPRIRQQIEHAKQSAKSSPPATKSKTAIRANRQQELHEERKANSWGQQLLPHGAPSQSESTLAKEGAEAKSNAASAPQVPTIEPLAFDPRKFAKVVD
ncbi:MAG: hypothetical protein DI587_26360 [Variovorax paradoxus]|nr:MAG: hypothetical protein DI583_26360 [Variovorax paradoxus]PZQ04755.1 MAG: hypothetical protein DI587_26360 [Variovorax paradoxus]